jgi:heme/copper-type cytochrome/quinol oxidase subunit 1
LQVSELHRAGRKCQNVGGFAKLLSPLKFTFGSDDFRTTLALGFGLSQLIFLACVLKCIRGGKAATPQVWETAQGLEWTLPSPAPYHSFETPPTVK